MKKVLSVALASAMVLGMGANAFAISYSTGSNDEADWPDNFQFDGSLFVTDKDGDLIEESTTDLNDNEAVDFEPGDVIWMPLYADDQLDYTADYTEGTDGKEAINSVSIDFGVLNFGDSMTAYLDPHTNIWYEDAAGTKPINTTGWTAASINAGANTLYKPVAAVNITG